jgi:hypothetical protein
MAKTVVPALGLKSFSCPHCGALAQQHWFRIFPSSYERDKAPSVMLHDDYDLDKIKKVEDKAERKKALDFIKRLTDHDVTHMIHQYGQDCHWQLHNVNASMCDSCYGWTLWVKDEVIYPVTNTEITAHEDLPNELRPDFEEAARIIDLSPRGSAALLRLCIQNLMPLVDAKGKDLNSQIGSLVQRGLEVQVQQALDVVRVVGNNAVHPGEIDLKDNKEIALKLFDLLNLIVERLISTPRKLDAIFTGLPEGARRAIEKRDAPKATERPESPDKNSTA